jgi:hypothetical protein
MGIRCADHATPSIGKVGINFIESGGRSFGIVRWRTKATEFVCDYLMILTAARNGKAVTEFEGL